MGDFTEKIERVKWNNNLQLNYIDLSSVNVENNSITQTILINKDNAPSRAQQIIKTNDILFGTTRPMLKRITYVNSEYNGQICSTGFCVIRVAGELVNPKWVYYQMSTEKFYNYVEQYQEGASYPCISDDKVKQYIIPLPPIEEQNRIVAILDRFDKLCNDISEGLPAEIEARQKQYEFYRDKLLQFGIRNS